MGVLDDAIREHLDLKRARGADPAEIERMEREALGPVRREPTVSSARYDTADEPPPPALAEPEFSTEHPTELEDLQDLGYHDSTAPHPHPHQHHDHRHDEHLEPEHDFHADAEAGGHEPEAAGHEPEAIGNGPEAIEPPRRRFLRRTRPASLAEPAPLPDPGFHEEPHLHEEPRFHEEPHPHEESHFHEEPVTEHHDVLQPDALRPREPGTSSSPPQLRFEHPPKRPRFTAEPPSLRQPEDDEQPDSPAEPRAAAPAPEAPAAAPEPDAAAPEREAPAPTAPAHPAPEYEHFDEPPAQAPDAQETTEFDVQKHLSEPAAEEDEDMLEETPDFLQDTPEHDRLWFEQRPPKDFDFNG